MLSDLSSPASRSDAGRGEFQEAEEDEIINEQALRDVEDMVQDMAEGIQETLIDNPSLKESLQKSLQEIRKAVNSTDDIITDVDDTVEKYCHPERKDYDTAVVAELQEAERQAQQTAAVIAEIKQSVAQLTEKPHMTDDENIQLEQKNKQLAALLQEFETKTHQIRMIVNHIDENYGKDNAIGEIQKQREIKDEEMLPKVIICGTIENNMPKLIICDTDKKVKNNSKTASSSPSPAAQSKFTEPPLLPPAVSVMPQFARRLNESYNMQEKLAAENADLEGKRYQLQEEIINKDQTVESLRQKVNCLQTELRVLLSEKLHKGDTCCGSGGHKGSKNPTMACNCPGKAPGICPGDVESRLQNYSDTTHVLEKQLGEMESQVKSMQAELESVQRERMMLEQQRRAVGGKSGPYATNNYHLSGGGGGGKVCMGPCSISGPCNNGPGEKPQEGESQILRNERMAYTTHAIRSASANTGSGGPVEQQLRELREQYARLQDDFRSKLTEVAQMRADAEILKQQIKDSELSREQAVSNLKDKEREIKNLQMEISRALGSKEYRAEQEQQLFLTRQKLRESQDELDELRSIVGDQTAQLDDYRNKYLQAQQIVEEQRRQIDVMEMENQRISDQVNLEIQRVKNQFQEKLQELTPLPDILKATQLKLQEAQQLQLMAERNAEKMELELQRSKDREMALISEIDKARETDSTTSDQVVKLTKMLHMCEKKYDELKFDNDNAKLEICRLEELNTQNEKRLDEKLHEIVQLNSQLEQLREESARQVARTKERAENLRRQLQMQISDMERQLVLSRASCRSAQKERDEIRQKMQCQINNLNENFEQAQSRIRSLQGHVNFLKNSYSNIFQEGDAGGQILEACSCNTTS